MKGILDEYCWSEVHAGGWSCETCWLSIVLAACVEAAAIIARDERSARPAGRATERSTLNTEQQPPHPCEPTDTEMERLTSRYPYLKAIAIAADGSSWTIWRHDGHGRELVVHAEVGQPITIEEH